jgi:hypothetical protein
MNKMNSTGGGPGERSARSDFGRELEGIYFVDLIQAHQIVTSGIAAEFEQ